jgi:SNF2 family DNA or RNA helicase
MSTPVLAPPASWPLQIKPWPHQAAALDYLLQRQGTMLAIGMGGGKGAVAIAAAEHAHAQRMLVLCPKNVVGVWPNQLAEHATRTWHVHRGIVQGARGPLTSPSVQKRAEQLQRDLADAARLGRPFAAVVNLEASPAPAMAAALLQIQWDLIVIDESHRIKAAGGQQSRFIGRLCTRQRQHGCRLLELTGTPMPHSALDLYAQYRALDPSIFGTSNAAFKARFGQKRIMRDKAGDPILLGGEPMYLTGPKGEPLYEGLRLEAADDFYERAGRIMFQVSQDELDLMLGLPDAVDIYRTTDLEPATRRVYKDLQKHLIAELDAGTVTSANAMVNILRLAQVTNGFAVDADTGVQHQLTDPPEKTRLLADVLQDLDRREPLVVFCRFHHDLDCVRQVCEQQGRRYGELSGRDRAGLTAKSTMRDDIDVLAVQHQAGGVGIDLTRARYGIYFSLSFALADYLQSRKRLHRPGQTRHVTYVHLLANDTVDIAIYQALKRRGDIVNTVLSHLKGKP